MSVEIKRTYTIVDKHCVTTSPEDLFISMMQQSAVCDEGRAKSNWDDYGTTIRCHYGIWLDQEMLCLCDTKEQAERKQTLYIKAIQAVREMKEADEISLLNVFDKPSPYEALGYRDFEEQAKENAKRHPNRIEFD